MVSSSAPVRSTHLLHIHPAHPAASLSEAQQAFNRLVAQLEDARQQWQLWQDATQAVHTRYAQQVRPVLEQLWRAQAALAQQLDSLSATRMSKRDALTLADMIVQLSEAGALQAEDRQVRRVLAELHARYTPHSTEDKPEAKDTSQSGSATAPSAQETPDDAGVKDTVDWSNPDAVAAYVEAQTQASQAQAQRARAAHQQQRKQAQAQRKAQAAEQASKPSVRAVYRKLASGLHPDREPDPLARERKTSLMQRVNQAYAADDLLALLELQWEVEQLDARRLAQLQDAHLEPYTLVLQAQLQQLQQATREAEAELADMLGLNPRQRHAPHKIPGMLRQYAQNLQRQVGQLQQAALQLQHQPEDLPEWLRAQR